ncbi:MAG: hypothetical protein JXQ90_08710 [Cyclobacteriaceae bacterium]
MKTTLKLLGHSTALLIFWIMSSMILTPLFDIQEPEQDNPALSLLLMWLVCLLNVSVLHLYLVNTGLSKLQRALHLFVLLFGIQWFMSQMESWFFIDEAVMSRSFIIFLIINGILMSLFYALMTYFTYPFVAKTSDISWLSNKQLVIRTVIAALLIYPAIYFCFGYFIAWQSPDLREYYTGSTDNAGFLTMMYHNIFESTLYVFQIFRTLLWLGLGWFMLNGFNGSRKNAMITLGLLFAVIMNSGHLLPNHIMPDMVRFYHAIETSSSNFLWGIIVVILFTKSTDITA